MCSFGFNLLRLFRDCTRGRGQGVTESSGAEVTTLPQVPNAAAAMPPCVSMTLKISRSGSDIPPVYSCLHYVGRATYVSLLASLYGLAWRPCAGACARGGVGGAFGSKDSMQAAIVVNLLHLIRA